MYSGAVHTPPGTRHDACGPRPQTPLPTQVTTALPLSPMATDGTGSLVTATGSGGAHVPLLERTAAMTLPFCDHVATATPPDETASAGRPTSAVPPEITTGDVNAPPATPDDAR